MHPVRNQKLELISMHPLEMIKNSLIGLKAIILNIASQLTVKPDARLCLMMSIGVQVPVMHKVLLGTQG
jgi:hypothetical protein